MPALPTDHPSPPRASASEMAATVARAVADGAFGAEHDAAVFYDLGRLDEMLALVATSFPSSAQHAIAVKANPLLEVLRRICSAGFGLEVASIGELALAEAAGVEPARIVFDSPAKTRAELAAALDRGVTINANCLDEVDRIAALAGSHPSSRIGIRVNPLIGMGEIRATSTATISSKFGVPISDPHGTLDEAFRRHGWIDGVHVHIGSQGMQLDQLVDGVQRVADLYEALREPAGLQRFNIGGGLPVAYGADDSPPTVPQYAAALEVAAPALFAPTTQLASELGRAIHANTGWACARIEYVLNNDDVPTVVTHLGADMFVREAYRPEDWHHEMSVTSPTGDLRRGELREFRVAGPLCFSGDFLSRSIELPADTQAGDLLLVHDAGAYTFSMWSVYNSRLFPTVLGIEPDGSFAVLRPKQETSDIVQFWGAPPS